MGTSLLFGSFARKVHTYFQNESFHSFLGSFGVALSSPHGDIDRNIFSDTWNSIQDAGNAAWNVAATTKDVTELIFRCKDVAIDLVTSVDVGAVTAELQPMLKDGLKNNDLQTIGNTIQGFSAKLNRMGECVSQTGEFKPQDWWNPFGRKMETASDRGFQLPTAYSLSFAASASGAVVAGATGSVEIGGAIQPSSGKMIGFTGGCAGPEAATELESIDGDVVFGFWNELGSIPGNSFTTGASIATPGIKLGVGVDLVWNDSGYIGTTITFLGGEDAPDFFLDLQASAMACYGKCIMGDCDKI